MVVQSMERPVAGLVGHSETFEGVVQGGGTVNIKTWNTLKDMLTGKGKLAVSPWFSLTRGRQRPGVSRYEPHQGQQERARRVRQALAGQLPPTMDGVRELRHAALAAKWAA